MQQSRNIVLKTLSGMSLFDPIGQPGLRGNGDAGRFGWPTAPRLEQLRTEWLDAPDLGTQKHIAREIQLQAWQDAPFLRLGQIMRPMVLRRELLDVPTGASKFYGAWRG